MAGLWQEKKRNVVDLDGRIRRAAVEAVEAVGLRGVSYSGLYKDREFKWAHVHFRTLTGEYFTVKILLGGRPEQPANTTVKALREQSVSALQSDQTF